jgi:hypothetical protein
MNGFPTAADFNARRVTNPSQSEVIRQRLYDFQLYPTAGVSQLTFFQNPIGTGITTALGATVGSAKTVADTSQELAGTLPSGKAFLIESIEVVFFPGSVSTANTYTVAAPGQFSATASTALLLQASDVNTIYQAGVLELNILSKNYVRETPLLSFPPKANYNLDAAVATNSATTGEVASINMRAAGRPYFVEPSIALQPAVNFEVVIKFPGVVATPSGFNGRIGVILDGYTMRASQ